MSKESFSDAYSTAVIDSLPADPWSITRTAAPEKKPKRTAEDRRQWMNAYQSNRRKTDEFRAKRREYNAIKRAANPKPSKTLPTPEEIEAKRLAHLEYVKNYKRMKRAAERVNPERSHSYTQADSDKTKRIAGKPNHRRSA